MKPETTPAGQRFAADGPKRILALDGGGVRGIVSLAYLKRIEELLSDRRSDGKQALLRDYFDLIAGTSTGAIIAGGLAIGMSVSEIIDRYFELGERVFRRGFLRSGKLRARYDDRELKHLLQDVFAPDVTLGSSKLETGLLVMTKRTDTGSPWPLGNNPCGRYFRAAEEDAWVSNADFPLWKVIRASTAAPSFFDPEPITIVERTPDRQAVHGRFVDGGVSPFNNPALQALLYATLEGYRVGWETGADKLLLTSVGTGRGDPAIAASPIAGIAAVNALLGLMDDCAATVETVLQWVSTSPTARVIDRELGSLAGDLLGQKPLLHYLRYDLELTADGLAGLGQELSGERIRGLKEMDEPDNMRILFELATAAAEEAVVADHFPHRFDRPE